jgi:hypothetical protein
LVLFRPPNLGVFSMRPPYTLAGVLFNYGLLIICSTSLPLNVDSLFCCLTMPHQLATRPSHPPLPHHAVNGPLWICLQCRVNERIGGRRVPQSCWIRSDIGMQSAVEHSGAGTVIWMGLLNIIPSFRTLPICLGWHLSGRRLHLKLKFPL